MSDDINGKDLISVLKRLRTAVNYESIEEVNGDIDLCIQEAEKLIYENRRVKKILNLNRKKIG
jgi:hypothetical protein